MADVSLILSPQQTQSATDAGHTQSGFPAGTLVSGTIAGKDANGNFLLKTSQGVFALHSATPLTYNSDVTLSVGAGNAPGSVNARIVSVNGESFQDFSAPAPEETDSVSPSLLASVAQTSPDNAVPAAGTVRAVIVSATPAPAAPEQATPPGFTPGNNVTLRFPDPSSPALEDQTQTQVTDQSPPTTSIANSASVAVQPQQTAETLQPATVQQALPPAQPALATPAGIPAAFATASPVETDLAPAQAVTQSPQTQAFQAETPQPSASNAPLYNAYIRQSATPEATPPAPAATAFPAQVINSNAGGNITLQTPVGTVTVQATPSPLLATLAPGLSLTLEVATNAQIAQENPLPATLSELASSWQTLKDIMTQGADNAAASPLLARLPQMGPAFLSESMAFIGGLLSGNTRKLLGEDMVEALKQNNRSDLLEKFSSEAALMSSAAATQGTRQSAGWQTLFLPFVYQEALQQARIYVKRDNAKKERAADRESNDTRFVVEVDLSELGTMQMDGLVRTHEKTVVFDLILRSHAAFSQEDQAEILQLYNQAAELTGFKGSLAFQVARAFPVNPLEEAMREEAHSITA